MKRRNFHPLIIIILLFLPGLSSLVAQPITLAADSLHQVCWNDHLPDSIRLEAALGLIKYKFSHSPQDLPAFATALDSLGRSKSAPDWLGMAIFCSARYQEQQQAFDLALAAYEKGHALVSKGSNSLLKATFLLNIGYVWGILGDKAKALQYYQQALSTLNAQNPQHQSLLARTYINLGIAEGQQKNYAKSLIFLQKAEKTAAKLPDEALKGLIDFNSGILFSALNLTGESKNSFNKAALHFAQLHDSIGLARAQLSLIPSAVDVTEAKKYFDRGMSMASGKGGGISQVGLCSVFGRFCLDHNLPDTALYYGQKGALIAQALHAPALNNRCQILIAAVNLKKNQPQLAIKGCYQILSAGNYDEDLSLHLWSVLSASYAQMEQYDSAYHYQSRLLALKDSLFSPAQIGNIMKTYLEFMFETEKEQLLVQQKQAEQITESQVQRQQFITIGLALLLLFLSTITLILYRYYRDKQKAAQVLTDLNQQLKAEQEQLSLSNRRLQRFAGVVSHDLLSNLDLILSSGNVLVGNQPTQKNLLQYYELSQNTSKQLKNYCLAMLQDARAKLQSRHYEQYNPMATVREVLHEFHAALQEKNFTVVLKELPASVLQPHVVRHVFQNLVSNALRYAGDQTAPQLRIEATSDANGKPCWVIEDNGPGITPEQRDLILSGAPIISAQGQGIGLTQVITSLLDYGATLTLEKSAGGGTSVKISFYELV